MVDCLICWIGRTDLRAPAEQDEIGLGPIAQAVESRTYGALDLITDYTEEEVGPYISWLRERTSAGIQVHPVSLTSPMDFGEIYQAAFRVVREVLDRSNGNPALAFHLSPGTSKRQRRH